jgi:hypothetical protein
MMAAREDGDQKTYPTPVSTPLRLLIADEPDRPTVDRDHAVPLHTFARRSEPALYDADGWPLLRDHATILFGDGGDGKSYLALRTAGLLVQLGARVLFCDWELSGPDHRDRLEQLFGPDMPVVAYLRCDRPLVQEVARISREVHRLSISYCVFDSIAYATAGPPEAAEHATAYFRAVRKIGIGSLHTAHVNKSETGDLKPFGSSFWHNSARATWYVKKVSGSKDRARFHLVNRKANLTPVHPAVGFQFEFGLDRTIVSRVDPVDVEPSADQLPTWQRIVNLIKAGGGVPRTIEEIATDLGAKPETVARVIRRSSLFTKLTNRPDGIPRIALAERRTE